MRALDLTGQRFGRWLAVKRKTVKNQSGNRRTHYVCHCDCGKIGSVAQDSLRSGKSVSCGCYQKDYLTTHGLSKTRTYHSWNCMIGRCYRLTDRYYADYGGRGIEVTPRWIAAYENFLGDMGEVPAGKTLERKDNEGNYTLSNCRWATHKEQARNRRNNRILEFRGVTKTLAEWSESTGIKYHVLHARVTKLNWSAERALTTPVRAKRAS